MKFVMFSHFSMYVMPKEGSGRNDFHLILFFEEWIGWVNFTAQNTDQNMVKKNSIIPYS